MRKFILFFVLSLTLCVQGIDYLQHSYAAVDPALVPQAPRTKDFLGGDSSARLGTELKATSGSEADLSKTGPMILNNYFFGFFGVLSTIIALRGGTKILFSGGDAKTLKEGILTIVNAAIGVILIGSSWAIVRLILQVNLGN